MNKLFNRIYNLLAILAIAGIALSCDDDTIEGDTVNQREYSIAQYIEAGSRTSNSSYKTLYRALEKANLVETLNGAGSFTLFAPSEAAFAAAGIDLDVISAEDLATVLTYHVVADTVSAPSGRIATVQGGEIAAYAGFINGIAEYDLQASLTNGLVYQIDRVLTPPAGNFAAVASGNASLSLITAAAVKAGIPLDTSAYLTLFLPNDDAMTGAGLDQAAIDAATPEALASVIAYHVLAGDNFSQVVADGRYPTLAGSLTDAPGLEIAAGDVIELNGSVEVVAANVIASNGVVHVIDGVLTPPTTMIDALGPAADVSLGNDAIIFDGLYAGMVTSGMDSIFDDFTMVYSVAGPCCGAFNQAIYATPEALTAAVQAHIFEGNLNPYGIATAGGTRFESIGGDKYVATASANGSFINGTWFNAFGSTSSTGITALYNGTTFSTFGGGVLRGLPEGSLLDSLNVPEYETFHALIQRVVPGISTGDYTVFAMDTVAINAAFGYTTVARADTADIAEFAALADHVVPGWYFDVDLDTGDGGTLSTAGGNELTYSTALDIIIDPLDPTTWITPSTDVNLSGTGVIHTVDELIELQ